MGFAATGLVEGLAFFFELGNVVANADEHLVELGELGFVADGAVAGDDDGLVGERWRGFVRLRGSCR